MKEGEPQKEPIQGKIERLVSHFGCEPGSIRTLRRTGPGKFHIILEAEKDERTWIIKATEPGINVARLRTESRLLSSAPRDYLKQNRILIPEIEHELTEFEGLHAIMISKIPKGKKPTFSDFRHVLEVLHGKEMTVFPEIKRLEPKDYLRRTLKRLNALRQIGDLKGLREGEVERIRAFYLKKWELLALFDRIFVHGDFKEKHVRRIGEELVLIDFDKSVIGCELEDWAWLSVRHPRLEAKIKDYLRERFTTNKIGKLRNFDAAFRLMQIDRVVEAYFTRTYQWRGNLDAFSYGVKIRGRYALNRLLRP